MGGFFLTLSGGLDSSTSALLVYSMARLVLSAINNGEEETLQALRRITGVKDLIPKTPETIASYLLHTAYMGSVHSSKETESRARRLAQVIGSYRANVTIDSAVAAFETIAGEAFSGFAAEFESRGGSSAESLAKQNIQARIRLVLSYSMTQLSTTARSR